MGLFVPGRASDGAAALAIVSEMGLLVSVDAFAAQFGRLRFRRRPDSAAAMVQRFLNGMEAAIAIAHPGGVEWCTEGVLWSARDALEDRLLHRVHDHVFAVLEEETTQDDALATALGQLAAAVQPAMLDVPRAF